MKTILTLLTLFLISGSALAAPLVMTQAEVDKVGNAIRANDSRARNVYISFKHRILYITRSIDINNKHQDQQSQSWCSSFPQFDTISIKALNGDIIGHAYCKLSRK